VYQLEFLSNGTAKNKKPRKKYAGPQQALSEKSHKTNRVKKKDGKKAENITLRNADCSNPVSKRAAEVTAPNAKRPTKWRRQKVWGSGLLGFLCSVRV